VEVQLVVSLTFSARGQLVFTGGQKFLSECIYKKNFPLNGQTRQAESF